MSEEQEKRDLIEQMGSDHNEIALAAVDKLRERGWLTDGSLRGAELEGANLSGANLDGSDLQGADLRQSWVGGTSFIRAKLTGAILADAIMFGADLRSADVTNANLSGAYLSEVQFGGRIIVHADENAVSSSPGDTMMRGADLTNATCGFTHFDNVDLSEVKGLDTITHEGPSEIGVQTLFRSKGKIPESFLRGCGVPDVLIDYLPSLVGKAIDFYSCFISYSSKDQEFTDQLAGRMRDKHLRVWYAPDDIKGGQKIIDQIDSAIRLHDKLILVLSPDSMHSEWVQREVRVTVQREREENRRKFVPHSIVYLQGIGSVGTLGQRPQSRSRGRKSANISSRISAIGRITTASARASSACWPICAKSEESGS